MNSKKNCLINYRSNFRKKMIKLKKTINKKNNNPSSNKKSYNFYSKNSFSYCFKLK